MTYEQIPPDKDPRLWNMARRRVAFKNHLMTYLIINTFFWLLWYLTGSRSYHAGGVPWPVWPALGWGIGLAFHYFGAYVNDGTNATEKEYEKLQNRK